MFTTLVTLFATTNSKSYNQYDASKKSYLSPILVADEYSIFYLDNSNDISLVLLFILELLLLLLVLECHLLLLHLVCSLVLLEVHLLVELHLQLLLTVHLILLMKLVLLLLRHSSRVLVLYLVFKLGVHLRLMRRLACDLLLMDLERILLHGWVVSEGLMLRLALSFHIHI